MNKRTTSVFSLLILSFFLSFAVISCGEDPVETFDRDKFIGEYLGTFTCMNPFLTPTINSDSLIFSITEGVGEDKSLVTFNLSIDGFPVPLEAVISGSTITLDDTVENLPIPLGTGEPIAGSVTGLGSAILSADGQSIAGSIKLTIVTDIATIEDDCVLTGNKL